jgi:hypothetical protein
MKISIFGIGTALALVAVPADAPASTQTGGKVTIIAVDNYGGPAAFQVTGGSRTTKPACATDDLWTIVNPATDNAKMLYAAILTAYSLGKQVTVVGTGACDPANPVRETVAYINAL